MNNIPPFGIHPSETLHRLYQNKPWQGQDPDQAKVIFLGIDANWDFRIEGKEELFVQVKKYLEDGVKFWEDNGFHHPLLLNTTKGSGKDYHSAFTRLGLTPNYAKHISFIELYGKPTYGSVGCLGGFSFLYLRDFPEYNKLLKRWLFET